MEWTTYIEALLYPPHLQTSDIGYSILTPTYVGPNIAGLVAMDEHIFHSFHVDDRTACQWRRLGHR